jgi:hypothetical protein
MVLGRAQARSAVGPRWAAGWVDPFFITFLLLFSERILEREKGFWVK